MIGLYYNIILHLYKTWKIKKDDFY